MRAREERRDPFRAPAHGEGPKPSAAAAPTAPMSTERRSGRVRGCAASGFSAARPRVRGGRWSIGRRSAAVQPDKRMGHNAFPHADAASRRTDTRRDGRSAGGVHGAGRASPSPGKPLARQPLQAIRRPTAASRMAGWRASPPTSYPSRIALCAASEIAGREQHRQIGPQTPRLTRQLQPRHAGHDQIGEEQRKAPRPPVLAARAQPSCTTQTRYPASASTAAATSATCRLSSTSRTSGARPAWPATAGSLCLGQGFGKRRRDVRLRLRQGPT